MPRSKEKIRRSAWEAAQLGADHARRFPNAPEPPPADMGTPNVSPGFCADTAGTRWGWQQTQKSRRTSQEHSASKPSVNNNAGWIITEAFGPHNDMGHLVLGVNLQTTPQHEVHYLTVDERKALEFTSDIIGGMWNIKNEKKLTDQQISSLWYLYQQVGVELGIENIFGPLTQKQQTQVRINSASEKRRLFREKVKPLLQTMAWFMQEGRKKALDKINMEFGSELIELYLADLDFLIGLPENEDRTEDIQDAVKRVNAVWSSLTRISREDDKREIATTVKRKRLFQVTENITVAASGEEEYLLGHRDDSLDTFSDPPLFAQLPGVRNFGAVLTSAFAKICQDELEDLIYSANYVSMEGLVRIHSLEENPDKYRSIKHPSVEGVYILFLDRHQVFPEMTDTPVIFASEDGLDFLGREKQLVQAIIEGKVRGKLLSSIETAEEGSDEFLRTLVIKPIKDGSKSVDASTLGQVVKLVYPVLMIEAGETVMRYLPPQKQLELMELARRKLGEIGYNVVTPLFATDEMIVTAEAPGNMGLDDFYYQVYMDSIAELRPLRGMIIDSILDLTQEAQKALIDVFPIPYESPEVSISYNHGNHSFDISFHLERQPERRSKLILDVGYREEIENIHDALSGLSNWRFDEKRFYEEMESLFAEREGPLSYQDVKACLKRSITLVDNAEMFWYAVQRQEFEHLAKKLDQDNLPIWKKYSYRLGETT